MAHSKGIVGGGAVLSPSAGAASLARIRWRTVRGTERTPPLVRNAELVAGNAMAACLPFFEAIALGKARTVRFGLSPTMLLEMEFDFQTRNDGSSP
jgi:hypothetical protein